MTSPQDQPRRILGTTAEGAVVIPLRPPAQAALVAATKHAVTCATCASGRACNELLELVNEAAQLNGAVLPRVICARGARSPGDTTPAHPAAHLELTLRSIHNKQQEDPRKPRMPEYAVIIPADLADPARLEAWPRISDSDQLRWMQRLVNGMIEALPCRVDRLLGAPVLMVGNEETKLLNLAPNPRATTLFTGGQDVIAGDVFLCLKRGDEMVGLPPHCDSGGSLNYGYDQVSSR